MKRLFTFFAVVFLVSTIAKADGLATFVLDDFENSMKYLGSFAHQKQFFFDFEINTPK